MHELCDIFSGPFTLLVNVTVRGDMFSMFHLRRSAVLLSACKKKRDLSATIHKHIDKMS